MNRAAGLIAHVYDTALVRGDFAGALNRISRSVGGTELCLVNMAGNVPQIIGSQDMAEARQHYSDQSWHLHDTRNHALLKRGPTNGLVVQDHHLFSPERMQSDAFYQDFCRPFELDWCSVWSYTTEGEAWGFSLLHRRRAGPLQGTNLQLIQRTAPHTIRAAIIASRIRFGEAVGMANAIDALGRGAIILNFLGKCTYVSEVAHQLFDKQFFIRAGELRANDRRADADLVAFADYARSPDPRLRMEGVAIAKADHAGAVLVTPIPLSGTTRDTWPGARLLLILSDFNASSVPDAAPVRKAFGWTPAETRVALALYRKADVVEVARQLGLRESTVRQYIKSLLSKSGLRKQSELILMLSKLDISQPRRGS